MATDDLGEESEQRMVSLRTWVAALAALWVFVHVGVAHGEVVIAYGADAGVSIAAHVESGTGYFADGNTLRCTETTFSSAVVLFTGLTPGATYTVKATLGFPNGTGTGVPGIVGVGTVPTGIDTLSTDRAANAQGEVRVTWEVTGQDEEAPHSARAYLRDVWVEDNTPPEPDQDGDGIPDDEDPDDDNDGIPDDEEEPGEPGDIDPDVPGGELPDLPSLPTLPVPPIGEWDFSCFTGLFDLLAEKYSIPTYAEIAGGATQVSFLDLRVPGPDGTVHTVTIHPGGQVGTWIQADWINEWRPKIRNMARLMLWTGALLFVLMALRQY